MHNRNPKKTLKEALDIALLKKDVMHHIAGDKVATKCAYGIIAVGAVLGAVGQMLFGIKIPFLGVVKIGLGAALGQAVMTVITTVIGLYLVSFIAKSIFKGSAKHDEFFRVAGFGTIVTFLGLYPSLSLISGIWGLVLFFVILKAVHKLTTGGVIGTFVVTLVAGFILSLILAPIYGMLGLGKMGGGSFEMNSKFMKGDSKGFEINVPGDEGGSVKFDAGSMKITGEDGETIEFNIPVDFK